MARRKRRRADNMGSVYERGPGNWWIKWREGGRVRYGHGYETKELAQRVLSKIVADLGAGRAGLPLDPKGQPTLSALAEDWLERRKQTHRAATDDAGRWNLHLKPYFGGCRPTELDPAGIRRFIESMLSEKLAPNTVGNCVRLLSTFYSDLVERGIAQVNPCRSLPRATRRLYKRKGDSATTPFLRTMDDVRSVYGALPEPINVAFAIGAFGGLRTGEVLGLQWSDIDFATRRIHVQRQVKDGHPEVPKDNDSRVVPIQAPLLPVLSGWKLKSGGVGLVLKPKYPKRGGRQGSPPTYVQPHTLWKQLKFALAACRLPEISWYQATRHTFASQWVLAGGSIMRLSKILGHSSVEVTEQYAHLLPDSFREAEFAMLNTDLAAGGEVVHMKAPETVQLAT